MKYYGKEKCRILKEIRAEIAKQNDIEWVVSECKHQGNCKGTCPKCEQEVRQLEEALARREALGKKVAVVGVSATIALTVTGCANPLFQTQGDMLPPEPGEPLYPATTAEQTETAVVDGQMPPVIDSELVTEIIQGELIPGESPETAETETAETDTETDTETYSETDTDAWPETDMGAPAWEGEMP
jgi:hypothetical protein